MSQFIEDFCNDLANINDNFLNTKQQNKMKVELIEEVKYNETIYWVKVDGLYVANKKTYEEAKEEFEKAANFIPKTTVLEIKEI
jgi:hypothetical protein